MPSIESAAVGDKLATREPDTRWGSNAPHVQHSIYTITKLTATQAVATKDGTAAEKRFRLKDGVEIGAGSRFNGAELATPELLAEHEAQRAALKRHRAAAERIDVVERAIRRRALTVEQMEAIAAAYEATLTTTGAPA